MVTQSSMPSFEEYCEEIKDIWETHWLTNMGSKHQELQKRLVEYLDVDEASSMVNVVISLLKKYK